MSNLSRKRVFVGMSGGVDSSVTAYLLKKQGYNVTGVFINGYNMDGCSARDAEEARRAAEHIGIPFYTLDLREEYFENVVQYMIDGYRSGLTPNPDVMCNRRIKFGIFLDKALKLGADYIATGHHARLRRKSEIPNSKSETTPKSKNSKLKTQLSIINYQLLTARDLNKDQSYFLWTLTQEQLKHCLFPIGDYTKTEVREIAKKAELPNAERKDSQGICFLGKVKLPDFLKEYIKPKMGDVLDTDGNKVGEHDGAQFYTIGQRHISVKFKIRNSKYEKGNRKPYYVVEKDIKRNILIVAEGDDNPALFRHEVKLCDVNFISSPQFITRLTRQPFLIRANKKIAGDGINVLARVRYRQPLARAILTIIDNRQATSKDKNMSHASLNISLTFDQPVKFVAPGQSAVFYQKSDSLMDSGLKCEDFEMLGGGVIV